MKSLIRYRSPKINFSKEPPPQKPFNTNEVCDTIGSIELRAAHEYLFTLVQLCAAYCILCIRLRIYNSIVGTE